MEIVCYTLVHQRHLPIITRLCNQGLQIAAGMMADLGQEYVNNNKLNNW